MTTIAVQLPGGRGPGDARKSFSSNVAADRERSQALEKALQGWMETELKKPIMTIVQKLDAVDQRVNKLESGLGKCLHSLSDLSTHGITIKLPPPPPAPAPPQPPKEPAVLPTEDIAKATFARRGSRTSTLPSRGPKRIWGGNPRTGTAAASAAAAGLLVCHGNGGGGGGGGGSRSNSRAGSKTSVAAPPAPQVLQVLPESNFEETIFRKRDTDLHTPKNDWLKWDAKPGGSTGTATTAATSMCQVRSHDFGRQDLILGPRNEEPSGSGSGVGVPGYSSSGGGGGPRRPSTSDSFRVQRPSITSTISSSNRSRPPPPPHVPVHTVVPPAGIKLRSRRPSMESMRSVTTGDSLFETRLKLTRTQARHGIWTGRIWRFLEDPDSGRWASSYASWASPIIMMSVMLTFIQTIVPCPLDRIVAAALETIVEVFWSVELIVRFVVSPNRKGFFTNFYSVLDLLSCFPLLLRAGVGFLLPTLEEADSSQPLAVARYVLLCFVPIFRLLKVLRRFEKFQLLLSAFRQVLEALPVLLYTQLLLTVVFSALIFLVEPRDNVGSLPTAAWLTIVTMTTVGYGDITPASPAGSLVVSFLVVSSVIFTSFPLGIIGSTFTSVWCDRDRILLMQRTRDCLDQWGYTAKDIVKLFKLADKDGDDELSLDEFRDLMYKMRLGLKEDRIVELFQFFDYDMSGTITHQEFCRVLFPSASIEEIMQEDSKDGKMGSKEHPIFAVIKSWEEANNAANAMNSLGDSIESVSSSDSDSSEEEPKRKSVASSLDSAESQHGAATQQQADKRDQPTKYQSH